MSPDLSQQQSRRRILRTLGVAGFLGIAGCSGSDTGDEQTQQPDTPTRTPASDTETPAAETETPSSPTETPSSPTETPEQESSPTPSDDDSTTPEDPSEPVERWGDIDPTGNPRYTEDPNWRMLGHDMGNTFCNPQASGPSEDPSVQWSIGDDLTPVIDSYMNHQPLIVDGTVYTTVQIESAREGSDSERWKFVAADADTGETETLFTVEDRLWRPTIVDGTVYIGVGLTLGAYDLETGTEQWRTAVDGGDEPLLINTHAIRYVDGVVIVTDSHDLMDFEGNKLPQHYGFDAATGEMLWNTVEDGKRDPSATLPLIADGLSLYPDMAWMRDIRTGERMVQLPTTVDHPVLYDGELYGLTGEIGDRTVVTYDWETLEQRWTFEADSLLAAGWVSVFDDTAVISVEDGFVGVDRETGERRWETNPTFAGRNDLTSALQVATTDTLYAVFSGGASAAIDPRTGDIVWQLKTDEMEWNAVSGCALADDLLLTVGPRGSLFAIS